MLRMILILRLNLGSRSSWIKDFTLPPIRRKRRLEGGTLICMSISTWMMTSLAWAKTIMGESWLEAGKWERVGKLTLH